MTLHHPGGHAGCSGDTLGLAATFRVGRYAFSPEDVRQCSAGHGHSRQEPPPTPPHTYSVNTATAGTTVSNEQLMALFEKPATAKRFVDTRHSSLFCKRTHRHVRKSEVLSGISWSKAISDEVSCAQRWLPPQSNLLARRAGARRAEAR